MSKNKDIELQFSERALGILTFIPPCEKNVPRSKHRIIRIRRNLIMAYTALNKELKRHRVSEYLKSNQT